MATLVVSAQGSAPHAAADGPRAAIDEARPGLAAGTLTEVALPGGLRAALGVVRDYNPPDRSQFLIEFIRRVHHLGESPEGPRDATLLALLAHLEGPAAAASDKPADRLPLPLTEAVWIQTVFGGQGTPETLLARVLRSRGASLLYSGLLALDDETRTFVAGQPALLTDLSSRLSAAFVMAAPGLRVKAGRFAPPGGEAATAAWEALAGKRVTDPADFLRAVLTQGAGRLAWFCGALGSLTSGELHVALALDAPDAQRVAAMRRLYDVFVRVAGDWRTDSRTFWRPTLDPSLLLESLPTDADGRPIVPGTRALWTAVFSDSVRVADPGPDAPGPDFAWLAERVFDGHPGDQRRRMHQVLYAARLAAPRTPADTRTLADVLVAAGRYPALIATLERLQVTDLGLIAQAARRATELASTDSGPRAVRSLAQFQGSLFLVERAAARGTIAPAAAADLVRTLVAVERDRRGDYAGRLVDWFEREIVAVSGTPDAPRERTVLRFVSGATSAPARTIDWEGTRYRIDLPEAETQRLERLLGEARRPWFSWAHTLVAIADAIDAGAPASERPSAETFGDIARRAGWPQADPRWRDPETLVRWREAAAWLARPQVPVKDRAPASRAFRVLADDLYARGVLELTYAIALGQTDRGWIVADDAAAAHDFGLEASGRNGEAAWRRPIAGADQRREWRATGSLLGLEVSLAELGLVRLSLRPPPRRPTINEDDRRVIVESVALVRPADITASGSARIVETLARGRARLAAVRTPADVAAVADKVRLSATRRTLLAWVVAHDAARVPAFLSPLELFWLGRDVASVDPELQTWGSPAEAQHGQLALRMPEPQPWEVFAGRWGSGFLAGVYPDLNLRLVELMAGLEAPPELLGAVLSAAALDCVNTAAVRSQDDRRSLVEFAQALTPERLEQYLALLTTGGPLVPLEGSEDDAEGKPGAPR